MLTETALVSLSSLIGRKVRWEQVTLPGAGRADLDVIRKYFVLRELFTGVFHLKGEGSQDIFNKVTPQA